MEYMELMSVVRRMCKTYKNCHHCPLNPFPQLASSDGPKCRGILFYLPEMYEEKVQKWSKEHPQKTILDNFKEKYPRAVLCTGEGGGYPLFCVTHLGCSKPLNCCKDCIPLDDIEPISCLDCWNRPMEDEDNGI